MSKINWLLRHTSPGQILLQSWLSKQGISKALANKYAQNQWLKKLYAGVYQVLGDESIWVDALNAINKQTKNVAWVSGLTSLENQGFNHYLSSSTKNWISFAKKCRVPVWFRKLFDADVLLMKASMAIDIDNALLTYQEIENTKVLVSSPELAILEILNCVPDVVDFDHASDIFNGLVSLSPRKITQALLLFDSVKVSRLCLYFAKYHNLAWRKGINQSIINLGTGKRQIVQGGTLEPEFQITIPSHYKA